MTRASVVVVSWNGKACLGDCLAATSAQVSPDDEIIVVDNDSADGSAALVRRGHPQVTLIENERNLGFAGGCNVGLRAARGEALILVNQDVVVGTGWLEAMLQALESPGVGIAGCKLRYPDGTIQHAGGAISYPLAHSTHYGYRELDRGQWDAQREVDYVIGASLGVKRAVLDEIGLLDEGFFPAFYEEVDLCRRAREAGYGVVYTPDGVAVHHETTTLDRDGIDYHRWMGRGRLRFVLKHYAPEQFHDDFVPAERRWLSTQEAFAVRAALRMAYLDTLLGLRDVPRTGVMGPEGSEPAVAEALIDLRAEIPVSAGGPPQETLFAHDLLAEVPWFVEERPFVSRVPLLGRLIVSFRELWNRVSAKWYVRLLTEQQNEVNRRLLLEIARTQEELAMVQEILASLDRETTDDRRVQAEAIADLQQRIECLQAKVGHGEPGEA